MEHQRIVVGIDGSDGSKAALRWAFAEARLRKAVLVPVMVWSYPYYVLPADTVMVAGAFENAEVLERERFDAILADAALDDPDVSVQPELVEGPTSRVLLDRAKGADLLVVGTRGRGGFGALVLGSVSTQCVHHAECPVVVVPPMRP